MVALAEAMAAADPADRTAQYNVAMTQIRLAESRFDNEDAAGALAPAERSIAVFRQMRAAGDQDVTRQRNFGPSLVSLGNVYLLLGRAPDARNMFREAFDLAEKETARNPRDVFSLRSGVLAAMGLAGAGSTEPLRFADLAVMLAARAVSVSAIPDLLSLQSRAHGQAALAYDKAGSESGDADLRTKARELAGQCRSEMEKLAPGSFLKWTDGGRQRRLRELIAEQ
jgi:tetratricopeptide (TPR) repeat protein